MDRYTRDELLDFQDDFTDDSRAAGEPPRVAAAGVPHENADADGGGLVPSGDPPTTREATSLPEQGENERASATAALHAVPGREETANPLAAGHAYLKSNNPRTTSCARCGRPLTDSVHLPPELDLAAVLSALERAGKSLREGNRHYAQSELAFALRVLRGDT